MKTHLFIMLFIVAVLSGRAQEFVTHQNDLIYDASTMEKLSHIVDSLNLKFKSCDLSHSYYGFTQGTATVFKLEGNAREARQAIRENISAAEFQQRFSKAEIIQNVRVTRRVGKNYKNEITITYSTLPGRKSGRNIIELPNKSEQMKTSGWVVNQSERSFVAFYLDSLTSPLIPTEYSRLIQYVDCMVDPSAEIFRAKSNQSVRGFVNIEDNKKASAFLAFAREFVAAPTWPEEIKSIKGRSEEDIAKLNAAWLKYDREHRTWDSLRIVDLDRRMLHSADKLELLKEGAAHALKTGESNDEFEFYISRYYSPALALELKRDRRVIGGCSMDQSPRIHAMNICVLAAQTTKWDIFLRSHLDIMNDRFSRMSDGSYAQGERQTYLRELEALNINAADLLIGSCLRTETVPDNHYFGDVGRVGRALSETSEPARVEKLFTSMITDVNLDVFNRLLLAYAYSHYVHNLKDETRKRENRNQLMIAVKSLPAEMASEFE